MKIRTRDQGNDVEVYAVYWYDNLRHYLVIPYTGYEGFDAYTENNSDLLDPSIDNFVVRKNSDGQDMLLHKAASQDDLLDELIEHDQDAMKTFLERLREYQ
jgi:hypothetical protein